MKSGSRLEQLLQAGQTVVTAEIMPPKTPSAHLLQKKARAMKGYITAANLTDNQSAMVRMSSLASSKIVMDAGIEPIFQITCRDRNRLAIQSDVIGAAALGIKNILCVTGDHQKFGNHPHSKNVYDMDSIQLIHTLKIMRDEGRFQNGEFIRNRLKSKIKPPEIFIGAAANPFGHPSDFRPLRLKKKVAAGADFIQTQPVFDLPVFLNWHKRVLELGLLEQTALLVGITPVRSVRALRYMDECVPGMHIPPEIIRRMSRADDMEQEGYQLARETIEQIRTLPGVRGIHLMAIGWEKIVPILVDDLQLHPAPGTP